jgi:mycothiol synthase
MERNRADFDEEPVEFSGPELREWWAERPERLATDSWIAVDDGQVIGFVRIGREAEVANVVDESCVHPEFRRRGIGSELVALAESWARERELSRIHVHVVNDGGRRMLEGLGYENVRFFWRMVVDVDGEHPQPTPPPGFLIRPYRPEADDEALHVMHQQAFAEHWEFVPQPLAEWLDWRQRRSDYDPELWQLAVHGEQIAGAALCFGWRDRGWVLDLAVGPQWRKQGLGLTLLQAGFHELSRRGFTHIGLEVDSENETGATRLYERASMRVTRRYATFEKRLSG